MATRLIELTRTADSSKVQVGVDSIVRVTPHGSGSLVFLASADPNVSVQEIVNETPAAITTAANA